MLLKSETDGRLEQNIMLGRRGISPLKEIRDFLKIHQKGDNSE